MFDGGEPAAAGQASPSSARAGPPLAPMGLLLPEPAIGTGVPASQATDSRGPLAPRWNHGLRLDGGEMTEVEQAPPGVDATTPTPARLYDYYLGGTNNFAIDREAAEQLRASLPELTDAAWANRGFHQRAARWMAGQHGIRQFIHLGSRLTTQGNTHEAVTSLAPAARVVYVDHDPMVLAHAKTLLSGTRATTVIQADLRDPDAVLGHPA